MRLQTAHQDCSSFVPHIGGTLRSGLDIGWASTLKVCLSYGDRLIGQISVPDKVVIPDGDNYMRTEWEEENKPQMKIMNMGAFKSFLEGVMPKKDTSDWLENEECTTAALSTSSDGHILRMSVDLSHMARMKTTIKSITRSENWISITISITNLSPLQLHFPGESGFVIKQRGQEIGNLWGAFYIELGEHNIELRGLIDDDVPGMAVLKGDSNQDSDSWQQYAIRLFEVEVNLDEAIVDDQ